ncbi:hypothetical protein MTR67_044268 [Solanum verrucosum]|uniref:Uncharacterized protein n=1 Tax=Solanum verrucosum TaxID=315347 RepID=A0AAF0ZV52_SOLVR|nr:hypothetical protein MTR67_044268 [Solanum verrucosum]
MSFLVATHMTGFCVVCTIRQLVDHSMSDVFDYNLPKKMFSHLRDSLGSRRSCFGRAGIHYVLCKERHSVVFRIYSNPQTLVNLVIPSTSSCTPNNHASDFGEFNHAADETSPKPEPNKIKDNESNEIVSTPLVYQG